MKVILNKEERIKLEKVLAHYMDDIDRNDLTCNPIGKARDISFIFIVEYMLTLISGEHEESKELHLPDKCVFTLNLIFKHFKANFPDSGRDLDELSNKLLKLNESI